MLGQIVRKLSGSIGRYVTHTERSFVVIDDDPTVAQLIEKHLGGSCLSFESYTAFRNWKGKPVPLCFFLDIYLGNNENGLEFIAELREAWPQIPVFIVTTSEKEKVIEDALSAGADDFITKPFSSAELKARVMSRLQLKAIETNQTHLRMGNTLLDLQRRRLKCDENTHHLSPTLCRLFQLLFLARGINIKKQQLKRNIWKDTKVTDNSVDKLIGEARKALASIGSTVALETSYGEGVKLVIRNKKNDDAHS